MSPGESYYPGSSVLHSCVCISGADLLDLPGQRRERHLHVVRAHVLPRVRREGEARQGELPHLQEEDRQRHQDVPQLARLDVILYLNHVNYISITVSHL